MGQSQMPQELYEIAERLKVEFEVERQSLPISIATPLRALKDAEFREENAVISDFRRRNKSS